MPGTPGRPRRSPARGVSDTLDQENVAPPAIDSPGGLMSKRKDRVSRRYSVLKVLGRTESAVSPGGEMPSSSAAMADAGPAAAAKKRRNSRVSFGHIQTAVFQKDSDRTDSPSSGNPPGVQFQQINTNNLSALPDDTVVPSPAASDSGSMDMDITRRDSLASVALSSLPPISDMAAGDASFASFASDDANNSRRESLAEQAAPAPKPAMSLADLIADDEGDERVNPLEFSANSARSMLRAPGDRTSSASDMQRADLTDHDLTADIKGPGDNTRKLGDHTGAFMAGEQTVALQQQQQQQRARDRESGAMELTTAYGGILSHAMAEESECADETVEMELTSAVGGIVEAKRRQSLTAAAKQRQSLAGVLSKVRGAMGEASEAAGTAPEAGVAMEMRGSFGRILSSAIGTGGAELDQTMEDEDTAEATGGAKTYHDDEVTMFTPLSRITKGKANAHKRTSLAADLVMDDSLPLQTRSRSTTPTGRRSSAAASEEKAEQYGNRRRSMRASLAAGMLEEDKIDTLDKFLEEIGIRFLTNVKHNKRKSSVGGMLTRASTDGAEATLHDKLLLVLTTGTETGQTEKNTKKLRDMLTVLSDAMSELEDAVNEKNPAVFAEVSLDADTEQALAVQKRMKTLKKLCRARAEIRWVAWRQEAALKMEEALLKNTDALMDDMRALDAALEKATAASLAAKQGYSTLCLLRACVRERVRMLTSIRRRRAEAVTELAATLDRLADSESEQGLVLEGLRSQVPPPATSLSTRALPVCRARGASLQRRL